MTLLQRISAFLHESSYTDVDIPRNFYLSCNIFDSSKRSYTKDPVFQQLLARELKGVSGIGGTPA